MRCEFIRTKVNLDNHAVNTAPAEDENLIFGIDAPSGALTRRCAIKIAPHHLCFHDIWRRWRAYIMKQWVRNLIEYKTETSL